jgi:hypothetical protein
MINSAKTRLFALAACVSRPARAPPEPDERPPESAMFNVNAGVRSELFPMRMV